MSGPGGVRRRDRLYDVDSEERRVQIEREKEVQGMLEHSMSVDLGRSSGICGMYMEGTVVVAFIGSFQISIHSAGFSLGYRCSIARALFYRYPLYTTMCTICMNRVPLSHGVSSFHYERST